MIVCTECDAKYEGSWYSAFLKGWVYKVEGGLKRILCPECEKKEQKTNE
jgi:hypothetical protein